MQRSQIQAAIAEAKCLLKKNNVNLPMFGYWKLDEWKAPEVDIGTILQTKRGWDVTDFGSDEFSKIGAVLFTIRNGILGKPDIGCPYAEKLIIMKDSQVLPLHFHYSKTEDIINRGGGVLNIQVFNSLPDGAVDYESAVSVFCDGICQTVKAGKIIEIMPGNSMTIIPFLYHQFAAKSGYGDLIVGEVSAINDDNIDNHFAVEMKRFSEIEEDEIVTIPLVNEYDKLT